MTKAKRNDPCPCGSGKKYKKCCYKEAADKRARRSGGGLRSLFNNKIPPPRTSKLLNNVKVVTGKAEDTFARVLAPATSQKAANSVVSEDKSAEISPSNEKNIIFSESDKKELGE